MIVETEHEPETPREDSPGSKKKKPLKTAGWVTLGLGAAVTVAGIVILVVDLKRERDDTQSVFLPSVGPGFVGVSFERRF